MISHLDHLAPRKCLCLEAQKPDQPLYLQRSGEVVAGNTSDKTTLADFLKKMEDQYGKAERIWLMDRGIPTEKVLEPMRAPQPPTQYLMGTPRGA